MATVSARQSHDVAEQLARRGRFRQRPVPGWRPSPWQSRARVAASDHKMNAAVSAFSCAPRASQSHASRCATVRVVPCRVPSPTVPPCARPERALATSCCWGRKAASVRRMPLQRDIASCRSRTGADAPRRGRPHGRTPRRRQSSVGRRRRGATCRSGERASNRRQRSGSPAPGRRWATLGRHPGALQKPHCADVRISRH